MKVALFFLMLVVGSQAMPPLNFIDDRYAEDKEEDSHVREKRDADSEVDMSNYGDADMVIYVKQNVEMGGGCCYSGCSGGCNHNCSDDDYTESTTEPETTTT